MGSSYIAKTGLLRHPEFHTLLPILQERCLKLLPNAFTLDDIVEENEDAICEAVRKKNLLPTHQGNWNKGEEIIDEFEFSPIHYAKRLLSHFRFFRQQSSLYQGIYGEPSMRNRRISRADIQLLKRLCGDERSANYGR